MRFATSGNGSKDLLPEAPRGSAVRAQTIEEFWMRFCGWRGLVGAGAICRSGWADNRAVKRRYYRWIEMGVLDAIDVAPNGGKLRR